MIDSELVPWGIGEKQAGEAVEIEPETICLQGTEVLSRIPQGAWRNNSVPIEEWANDLFCVACLSTIRAKA